MTTTHWDSSKSQVAQQTFPYRVHWSVLALLYGLAMFVAALAMGSSMVLRKHMVQGTMRDAALDLVLVITFLVGGLFLAWLAWRLPRLAIRVSQAGMEASKILGSARIAWEDVVSVVEEEVTVWIGGAPLTYVRRTIRSRYSSIVIPDKLLRLEELWNIIRSNVPPSAFNANQVSK
jgi:hypothetical protein